MTDFVREMVSQNKVRYRGEGYNLDLTYITPNIIAMGFPSSSFESVYRNDVDDVVRFLEERHRGYYLVINLCSEKFYNPDTFQGRVWSFPIDDHGPPPFRSFLPFCKRVDDWLSANPRNVVAIHCMAGKDRTGTMISAYFLYKGMTRSAEEAVQLFANQRTYDGKGVVIPSQRRYVKYFELFLSRSSRPAHVSNSAYTPVNLLLTAIVISPPPTRSGFDCDLFFTVQSAGRVYTSEAHDSRERGRGRLILLPHSPVPCCEDVKVVIYSRAGLVGREEMFRFWFNTFFVPTIGSTPQQQVISGSKALQRPLVNARGANPVCTSCQSNQPYLSERPSGSFVSVVRLSHQGQAADRGRPPSDCRCCAGAQCRPNSEVGPLQRALTLHRGEMECGEKAGPENVAVTVHFTELV